MSVNSMVELKTQHDPAPKWQEGMQLGLEQSVREPDKAA
jgi:hypothetical protein